MEVGDGGGTDDDPRTDSGGVDRDARGLARPAAGRRENRTTRRRRSRPCRGRSHGCSVDARSRFDRSCGPSRTDAREGAAASAALARPAGRGRGAVTDDESALRSPDTTGRPDQAEADRLHLGRVVHVHAAEAAAASARPCPRSPEPDRPVAVLAPWRRGAHADRWLGAIDGDVARGPSAADGHGPRCMALAHRRGHAPAHPARGVAQPGRARLATARRGMGAATRPAPCRPVRTPVRRVVRRGAARGSGRSLRGGRRSLRRRQPRRRTTRATRRPAAAAAAA